MPAQSETKRSDVKFFAHVTGEPKLYKDRKRVWKKHTDDVLVMRQTMGPVYDRQVATRRSSHMYAPNPSLSHHPITTPLILNILIGVTMHDRSAAERCCSRRKSHQVQLLHKCRATRENQPFVALSLCTEKIATATPMFTNVLLVQAERCKLIVTKYAVIFYVDGRD